MAGESAEVRWQVAGESKVYFLPGTFYANIKSAWESAEVNGTFL